MPQTYDSIATVTLGSNTSTTTFSSIPQTYTDLRLVCYIKPSSAGGGGSEAFPALTFNSAISEYGSQSIGGNGAGATQGGSLSGQGYGGGPSYPGGLQGTAFFSVVSFDIFQYTSASTQKTYLMELGQDINGGGWSSIGVGLWTTSAAITSLTLYWAGIGKSGVTGSTATLYGIKAA